MFILYDLIFIIFAVVYLPYFLVRKKLHRGFMQRLGFFPADLKLGPSLDRNRKAYPSGLGRPIWVHAVSVGEAKIAEILVKQLRRMYPERRFILSSVTPTGNRIIRSFRKEHDLIFYLPLDLSFITKRVIRKLCPCICIIMETEIWPNLITQLNKMNVPVVLVNARISDRSFLGYRAIKAFIKPIVNKIDLFCAQSKRDAQRLSILGAPSNKVKVTGNMKFDFSRHSGIPPEAGKDYIDYRLKLGLEFTERLFVAGSTHQGEEKIILNVYKQLQNEFPDLRLLIAPRHPERSSEIEKLIRRYNLQTLRISQLNLSSITYHPSPIFILDTIGQLLSFYAIADIVFVGGSLVKKGGHNILEPALFEKPILFGPYMFNFRDIADLFLTEGAVCMIDGQKELSKKIRFLLSNPSEIETMGKKARQLIMENQGATARNIQLIGTVGGLNRCTGCG